MKSAHWFAVLCSFTLSSVTSLQGQAPQILEPKVERLQGPPLWLSADAVADEKRVVNLDRLDSEFLRGIVDKQWRALGDRARAQQAETGSKPAISSIPLDECRNRLLATSHGENENPSSTLTDLLTYSESILRGTIRSSEPGFTFGEPSSLLVVEVTDRIRGAAPPQTLYVSYPVAHFRIGPLHFCNGTQGFEPLAGDEILLFAYSGAVDREGLLYVPRMEQLIFQRAAGPLILSSGLKNTPSLQTVRTLDDFVRRLLTDSFDPSCLGHIMGSRNAGGTRAVAYDDCAVADDKWETTEESQPANDPYCEVYCWTSCTGSYCPTRPPGAEGCPVLLDLEGDGIHLTGLDNPVWFDIDADGQLDLMSWTDGGEGILVLDRDGNSLIDHGGELFGNFTRLSDGSLAPNGYVALAELDKPAFGGNSDGRIDLLDAAFLQLRLWSDTNHDATSEESELLTLSQARVSAVGLAYRRSNRTDQYGNELRFRGRAWRTGKKGAERPVPTWDVFFLVVP